MKSYIKTSISCLLLLLLLSCGNNQPDKHNHEAESFDTHEHQEDKTTTTLTAEQIKTVGIEFGTVENKELTATIRANGMLRVPNNNRANASTLYGGIVKTLNVQVGDNVKKGQIIATVANPEFIRLQEDYLTVSSRLILAEQELQRQKELNDGNAGAYKNLQSATTELSALRTRKVSLQEQIQLMGINPNTISNANFHSVLLVKSPINGVVSNLFATIGSYVDVSSPLAEIVDNSSLHLDLQVFEKDLPLLKVSQIIHFTLTNNPTSEYDAEVFSIGAAFENDSKTIPVHARVLGNKTGLIDGMNITGIVSLNNVTSPAVPNNAIVEADGKYYIFTVNDESIQPHVHDENEAPHNHENSSTISNDVKSVNFKKVEVIKGVSDMGFTAVIFVDDIPKHSKIVIKGAFFINAKLTNTSNHAH